MNQHMNQLTHVRPGWRSLVVMLGAGTVLGCGGPGTKATKQPAGGPVEAKSKAGSSAIAALVEQARAGREKLDADLMLSAFTSGEDLINVGAEIELPLVGGAELAKAVRGAFAGGMRPAKRQVGRSAEWTSADGRLAAWAGEIEERGEATMPKPDGSAEKKRYRIALGMSAFARRSAAGKLELVLSRVGSLLSAEAHLSWGEKVGASAQVPAGLEAEIDGTAATQAFAAAAQQVLALQRARSAEDAEALLAPGAVLLVGSAGSAGGDGVATTAAARTAWLEARAQAALGGREVEVLGIVGRETPEHDAAWLMLDLLERRGGSAAALRVTAAAVRDADGRMKLVLVHEAVPTLTAMLATESIDQEQPGK